MPLWQLLYLQSLDIHYCRCSFLDQCIYIFLFSWPADASHWNYASSTCSFHDLQILLIFFEFYLIHDCLQERKDYALLLSFVGQARLQFAGLHSLFLLGGIPWLKDVERWRIYFSGVWCIYILELFACADAFFAPCICTDLIFAVADAFVATVVSAIPWYSLL